MRFIKSLLFLIYIITNKTISNITSNIISPSPKLDSRGHEPAGSYNFVLLQIEIKHSIKNTKEALIIKISDTNNLNCVFLFSRMSPITPIANATTFKTNAPEEPIN